MAPPMMPASYPDPYEYLMRYNCVRVIENINLWETFTAFNSGRKYAIFLVNSEDDEIPNNQQPLMNAVEESNCCERQMCGSHRNFNMNIFGPDNNVMVTMNRPFTCQIFCLNTPEMHILDANGQSCGYVKNIFHCFNHNFSIVDDTGAECMTIESTCCQPGEWCFLPFGACSEIVYNVVNNRTNTVGCIKRKWDSWARQLFTNADTFTITFPPQSNVHERLLLLAATFLINVMYFEHRQRDNHSSSSSGFDSSC